jgi:hypothetical protein
MRSAWYEAGTWQIVLVIDLDGQKCSRKMRKLGLRNPAAFFDRIGRSQMWRTTSRNVESAACLSADRFPAGRFWR